MPIGTISVIGKIDCQLNRKRAPRQSRAPGSQLNDLPIKTMPLWLGEHDRGKGHISKAQIGLSGFVEISRQLADQPLAQLAELGLLIRTPGQRAARLYGTQTKAGGEQPGADPLRGAGG